MRYWLVLGARERFARQAKLVVLLLFCLLNPFAGWAYLATAREKWRRDEAPIGDTLKRRRLVVMPPSTSSAERNTLGNTWLEAILTGLHGHDALETTVATADAERDALTSGRELEGDLVLDASLSFADAELRLFARLIRLSDASVPWSQSYAGSRGDLDSFCDDVVLSVLRSLSME